MNALDPIATIAQELKTKSVAKQQTYRNLKAIFNRMARISGDVLAKLENDCKLQDEDITLGVMPVSEQEFHVKLAGDMLVFLLHSNIITLPPEHAINKSKAIDDDPMKKYFGQILVYNFMSDSIEYNRLGDPGYLIARFLLNYVNEFFIEGQGQLGYQTAQLSEKPVVSTDLSVFIQLSLMRAIQNDLVAPPFPNLKPITILQKNHHAVELGAGTKIGFKMSYDQS